MQKYIIKDGKAVNFINADDDFELPEEMGALVAVETVDPSMLEGTPYAPPPPPVVAPPTKDELKAAAASKRYDIETGGVTVNGASIATDRDSQSMIANALDYLDRNPEAKSVDFKASGQWVTLDAANLAGIGVAVGAHVQACFKAEKEIDAAIDASTVKTLDDIEKWNWPT